MLPVGSDSTRNKSLEIEGTQSVANYSGYIKVDWKRVEKDVNKAKRQLRKKANKAAPEINSFIEESAEFVKKNIVLTSGFVGGFLLGLAS
ncbi:hypothetical protein scyTo_0011476 [Scyliorhinus torazame]|uniref:FUN14 domain-containing protein 1 n=1 Tax=Scyliorhinus torazame TaxID=75743 RepID=A0A401NNS4_SCYTO|nr:hypothetical protein [Scyliorhinus torazame]